VSLAINERAWIISAALSSRHPPSRQEVPDKLAISLFDVTIGYKLLHLQVIALSGVFSPHVLRKDFPDA